MSGEWLALPGFAPASAQLHFKEAENCISACDLRKRLHPKDADLRQCIKYLNDGLIRAYAPKSFFGQLQCNDNPTYWRSSEDFLAVARTHGTTGPYNGWVAIGRDFWEIDHLIDTSRWEGGANMFEVATLADWRFGRFESLAPSVDFLPYEDSSVRFDYMNLSQFFGVCFAADDIQTLFPMATEPEAKPSAQRASKYSWEAAISAFCADQWKQDIIVDIYAHGAMAKIEKWLGDWFSEGDNIPSDSAIKTRARMILDDMKRADKA